MHATFLWFRIGDRVEEVLSAPSDVCGEESNPVCERAFDWSGGNRAVAIAADWLVGKPLAIVAILLAGLVVRAIVHRLIVRGVAGAVGSSSRMRGRWRARNDEIIATTAPTATTESETGPDDDPGALRRASRTKAITSALISLSSAIIWMVVLFNIAVVFGLDLEPLLASAGLAGIAVAFGAQSLIKDWLAGLFVIIEDHYGIGDSINAGGEAIGVVEQMTLRVTVVRDVNGTLWHVSNGDIQRVGNRSQLWSVAIVDIDVDHATNLSTALRTMGEAAADITERGPLADDALESPNVLGVQDIAPDGITLRVTVRTKAGRHWVMQRAIRQEVKHRFDAEGIEFAVSATPYPVPAVDVGSASEHT